MKYYSIFLQITVVQFVSTLTNGNEKPKILFILDGNKVILGEKYFVTCVSSGNPAPDIHWYMNKEPIITIFDKVSESTIEIYHNRYLSVVFKGKKITKSTLIFKKVINEDHNKFLTCESENAIGSDTQTTKIVILPQDKRNLRNYPIARLIDLGQSSLKKVNSHVTLKCDHGKASNAKTYWFRNFEILMEKDYDFIESIGSSNIINKNITKKDEGSYNCLVINSVASQLSFSVIIEITDIPNPISNIELSEIFSTSVNICCIAEYSNKIIQELIIHYESKYYNNVEKIKNIRNVKRIGRNEPVCHKVMNLMPFTEHKLWVFAKNDLGISAKGRILKFTTSEDVPGEPPKSITASAISNTAVEVRWRPLEKINGILKNYVLLYTEHPDLPHQHWRQVNVGTESALLSHLSPDKILNIRIQAINGVGDGPLSKSVAILTKSGTISECPEFRASLILLNLVKLEWGNPDPTEQQSCNGYFLNKTYINFSDNSKTETVILTKNKRSCEMKYVKENVRIAFTLQAHNSVGPGMPVNLEILSAGKAKINRHVIEVSAITPFTISTQWRRPINSTSNITLQLMHIDTINPSNIPLKTHHIKESLFHQNIDEWQLFNFTRLLPNISYQIRLTFIQEEESGTLRESYYESEIVKTKTSSPLALGYFTAKLVQHNRINFRILANWEDLPDFYDLKKGAEYRIKYRISSPEVLISSFEYIYTNVSSCYIHPYKELLHGATYEVTLSRKENHNPKYEVTKFINIPEEKPTYWPSNPVLYNMTQSSVTIQWSNLPLQFRGGQLVAFELELSQSSNIIRKLNSTSCTFALINLKFGDYKARIRAYTKVGSGPWSNVINFNIKRIDINPPDNIVAKRINNSMIRVKWEMPRGRDSVPYIFHKEILGFVLYYATKDTLNNTSTWLQKKIINETLSCDISNLQANEFYIVRISSIDEYQRIGKWSEPAFPKHVDSEVYRDSQLLRHVNCVNIRRDSLEIISDLPDDVVGLKRIIITYNGSSQYWSQSNPHQIKNYMGKEVIVLYSPEMKTFKRSLENLDSNTNYTINLKLDYTKIPNTNANPFVTLQCKTRVNTPWFIPSPKVLVTTYLYITLQLLRVDESHGKIDQYHLLVVPYKSNNNSIFEEYNKDPNSFTLIELSIGRIQRKRTFKFLAFSKTTNSLFGDANSLEFSIFATSPNGENVVEIDDSIIYRAALRACVEVEDGENICNTSKWSREFKISHKGPLINTGATRSIQQHGQKNQFNGQAIVTVSITLFGILIAIVSIIIGCIIHKRKMKKAHSQSDERISSPELLQDIQMAPLVDVGCPKTDRSVHYTNNNPNFTFDTQNDTTLLTSFVQNSYRRPNCDSRTMFLPNEIVNKDSTPDLVNVKSNFNYFSQDSPSLPSGNQMRHLIPIHLLSAYVEEFKKYESVKIMREYEELNKSNYENMTATISNLPHNKFKNRYANVVAYDHSLVLLQNGLENQENNYINANYIDGYRKQNEFIATQGPILETIDDFWQMVWEQRSLFIIMLIRLNESETKKCDLYWPRRGSRTYRLVEVSLIKEIERAYYTIRLFQLKQNGFQEKRQIFHLHFTAWPDQGIPLLCAPFLSFIKVYRSFKKLDCGPTVVHCSAGVGRTGVFIVLDSQIERMKHEKSLNVYDEVKKLRKQRNYMVQTEAQYELIFDLLLEWSHNSVEEIPPGSLSEYVDKKSQFQDGHSLTGFEIEFQQLNIQTSNTNSGVAKIYGNSAINKQKNNSHSFVPFDWNRVVLSSISGVEGSDYINASFIDSYLKTKTYIVSQSPMPSTVEDFWRLVWDNGCSIIVVLGKMSEFVKEQSVPYWPIQKSIRYQFFVVDPLVEYNMCHYTMREFKITDARDGEFRTIRQFHFSKWLDHAIPIDCCSFLEFTNQVQLTKEKFGHGNPLLVHCSYGTGKSGIFVAVNNILEKLRHENVIDVYGMVKLLQQQRLGLVQTADQYRFIYYVLYTHLLDTKQNIKAQVWENT